MGIFKIYYKNIPLLMLILTEWALIDRIAELPGMEGKGIIILLSIVVGVMGISSGFRARVIINKEINNV